MGPGGRGRSGAPGPDGLDPRAALLDGDDLDQDDTDLRSEQSRWESLLSRINSKPGPIVHAANVAGGMDKLRAANPPAESFWWHLDSEVAKRRFHSIRRSVTTLVAVVLVAVVGYYAINYFFPPEDRKSVV